MTKLADARRKVWVENVIYLDGVKVKDVVELLDDELKKIPEDKREEAYIDIDSWEEYGSARTEIRIKFTRLETWDEVEKRLAQAKVQEDRRIAEAKKILGIK